MAPVPVDFIKWSLAQVDTEGGVAVQELRGSGATSCALTEEGRWPWAPPAPRLVWAEETFGMEGVCFQAFEDAAHISLWEQGRPTDCQSSGGQPSWERRTKSVPDLPIGKGRSMTPRHVLTRESGSSDFTVSNANVLVGRWDSIQPGNVSSEPLTSSEAAPLCTKIGCQFC